MESSKLETDIYYALRNFRNNGILTPELRFLFSERRKQSRLSRPRLALLFNTTAQTIFFWESGRTRRCSIIHREAIINFITGAYGRLLISQLPVPRREKDTKAPLIDHQSPPLHASNRLWSKPPKTITWRLRT